jgi:flagellar biosynthesis chaperone FliJ
MSGYPLEGVLELRRREEEDAAADLANAVRSREVTEREAAQKEAMLSAARVRWQAAHDADGGDTIVAQARFVARLHHDLQRSQDALAAFRTGPLADAHAVEQQMRDKHLAASQAREAFEKHEAKFRAAERCNEERREQESSEDAARAARHGERAIDP